MVERSPGFFSDGFKINVFPHVTAIGNICIVHKQLFRRTFPKLEQHVYCYTISKEEHNDEGEQSNCPSRKIS